MELEPNCKSLQPNTILAIVDKKSLKKDLSIQRELHRTNLNLL